MANLPYDIMLDICVRLPVKTIGRFRCVNKTWHKLLNDPEFVQKHLYHATEINRLSFMLRLRNESRNKFYTINYDPSSSTCTGSVNTIVPFVTSIIHYYENLQFLGYCNGLVCLTKNGDVHFLWNPSTNEYKKLPVNTTPDFYGGYHIEDTHGGFGYDYKNAEFKVVCLTQYGHYPDCEVQGSMVHLHTLGSDTWKTLESIPYRVYGHPDAAQVLVNGVIYWVAAHREYDETYRKVILSFDFEKEIFQEMPLPDLLSLEFRTSLCVLGGSLCIRGFDPDSCVEVWELKECEVGKSWIKLVSIDLEENFGSVKDFVPLQLLKNGEFLYGFDTVCWFSRPSV